MTVRGSAPLEVLGWLNAVGDIGAGRPVLPSDPVAWGLLEQLGVAARDRNAVLAARPDPHEQPGLWLALEQNLSDALNNMGEPPPRFVSWQPPATGVGRAARHLSVWTLLATLPYVRKYHALHEVPDEISGETLGFLGAAMRSYRERTGLSGVLSGLGPHRSRRFVSTWSARLRSACRRQPWISNGRRRCIAQNLVAGPHPRSQWPARS